jgi:SulP family sulfate permease
MHQDGTLRDAERHNLPRLHGRLAAIRFDGALRFVNVSYFENAILKLERDNPEVDHILVKGSGINEIDASGVEMLSNLITRFKSNGITLCFSGFKKQTLDVIERTGLIDKIGSENLFSTDQAALDALEPQLQGHPTELVAAIA